MNITAITRYKHGDLLAALNRLGWTQSDLARKAGLTPGQIGRVMNLNQRPSREVADAIQKALGEGGEYFDVLEQWPESFTGIKAGTRSERTMDVPMECLIGCREAMMLPAPTDNLEIEEISEAIDEVLSHLSEKERRVIELRFFEGKTLEDVARSMGTHPSYARQLQDKALRRMRHPQRARHLIGFQSIPVMGGSDLGTDTAA